MRATLFTKDDAKAPHQRQILPLCVRVEAGAHNLLTEHVPAASASSRRLRSHWWHRTDSHGVYAAKASALAMEMDVPHMFRYRRPPKREIYSKLLLLFAFGIFCALVGLNVADLPLPCSKLLVDAGPHPDEDEVFTFPTFSPDERIKLAEISSRIAVPYLMPWGEDERPAMFFMWHLLYRSIKPDLDHFEAQLRSIAGAHNASSALGGAPSHDVFKVVIDVVEAHEGYITTSLAHFLPSAYVFSIVASAPTAQIYGRNHAWPPNMRGSYGSRAEDMIAERRAHAEKVAAKVERVLESPAAERNVEASQQPGSNGVQPIPPADARTMTSEKGIAGIRSSGGSVAEELTGNATATRAHPHLYLCVPQYDLNHSYIADTAAQGLHVNYQIILYPHVALRGLRTAAEFDAALRALLVQANVASFIALPWMSEIYDAEREHADQGERALRRRGLLDQELQDYEGWYADRWTPLQVLQRALSGPEMEAQYRVAIVPLGSKRWFGALRQLFRVELLKQGKRDPNTTVPSTTVPVDSASAAGQGVLAAASTSGTGTQASPLPSLGAGNTFGCSARLALLGCMARAKHSSCEQFSNVNVT
ncbi:hypothetical protein LSCM1_01799 [Leishmania martiniquensis]|uniref:Uncharacterized protein n=1 Tax=Leishmania martiniquensis TaxID=1580590 RepID=A0A836KH60_9TRYP|nr:hypothetical protein LSCM1_01799 [Leishmania martiniquensis]